MNDGSFPLNTQSASSHYFTCTSPYLDLLSDERIDMINDFQQKERHLLIRSYHAIREIDRQQSATPVGASLFVQGYRLITHPSRAQISRYSPVPHCYVLNLGHERIRKAPIPLIHEKHRDRQ